MLNITKVFHKKKTYHQLALALEKFPGGAAFMVTLTDPPFIKVSV